MEVSVLGVVPRMMARSTSEANGRKSEWAEIGHSEISPGCVASATLRYQEVTDRIRDEKLPMVLASEAK